MLEIALSLVSSTIFYDTDGKCRALNKFIFCEDSLSPVHAMFPECSSKDMSNVTPQLIQRGVTEIGNFETIVLRPDAYSVLTLPYMNQSVLFYTVG